MKIWLDLVEQAFGKKPIIYSTKFFLQDYLSQPGGGPPDWVNEYPLWIAQYPNAYNDSLQPPLPTGWSDWTFWQYTENGEVNGIVSNVYVSVFNGTTEELQKFFISSSSIVIPEPSLTP